jgi:hypothetical protein
MLLLSLLHYPLGRHRYLQMNLWILEEGKKKKEL